MGCMACQDLVEPEDLGFPHLWASSMRKQTWLQLSLPLVLERPI